MRDISLRKFDFRFYGETLSIMHPVLYPHVSSRIALFIKSDEGKGKKELLTIGRERQKKKKKKRGFMHKK